MFRQRATGLEDVAPGEVVVVLSPSGQSPGTGFQEPLTRHQGLQGGLRGQGPACSLPKPLSDRPAHPELHPHTLGGQDTRAGGGTPELSQRSSFSPLPTSLLTPVPKVLIYPARGPPLVSAMTSFLQTSTTAISMLSPHLSLLHRLPPGQGLPPPLDSWHTCLSCESLGALQKVALPAPLSTPLPLLLAALSSPPHTSFFGKEPKLPSC